MLQNQSSYQFNEELTKRNSPTVREGSAMLAKPITDALAAGIKAFSDYGSVIVAGLAAFAVVAV